MSFLVVEAKMENLEKAVDFIFINAEKIGFDKINLNRIRLASEEIIVNIIKYAYPDSNGTIEIICDEYSEKKGVIIEISDSGIPFDPLLHIPPDTLKMPLEKRPIGGLGIYLVSMVMNSLAYKRKNNKNILTLIKYLT